MKKIIFSLVIYKQKLEDILPLLLSLFILISVKISFASDKFILNAERVKFNYFLDDIAK